MNRNAEGAMPLTGHLAELRSRLIVAVVAILVATTAAFIFSDQIIAILKAPGGVQTNQLQVFSPMDGFFVKWRVSLFAGLALAFPIWAYEVVAFITPGLTSEERRLIVPVVGAGFGLFLVGVAFGYYLLYEMIAVLTAFNGSQLHYFPAADQYISFVTFFLLSTGIAFELPVVLYALVRLKVLPLSVLKRQRRYFYFAMFVVAEVITPVSDPIIAPLTITVPMVLLYELTILVAGLSIKGEPARPALVNYNSNYEDEEQVEEAEAEKALEKID